MLPGEEEVVRAWYHRELPGGMSGDWRYEATKIERSHCDPEDIKRARRLRQCAELSMMGRLHITFTGSDSSSTNCVWCSTGTSAGT